MTIFSAPPNSLRQMSVAYSLLFAYNPIAGPTSSFCCSSTFCVCEIELLKA